MIFLSDQPARSSEFESFALSSLDLGNGEEQSTFHLSNFQLQDWNFLSDILNGRNESNDRKQEHSRGRTKYDFQPFFRLSIAYKIGKTITLYFSDLLLTFSSYPKYRNMSLCCKIKCDAWVTCWKWLFISLSTWSISKIQEVRVRKNIKCSQKLFR